MMRKSFLSSSYVVSRGASEIALLPTRSIGLAAMASVFFLVALAGCSRTPNPNVWATVDGHPIMKSEVDKYYQAKVNSMQQQPTADEEATLKLDILHQRIGEEMIRQQAEKLHLVAADAEVDAKIAQLKAPYTDEQFDAKLKSQGLTLADARREIWLNLTEEKVLNREIESKINITDDDVSNFYNLHKADFNLIEPEYHLARIIVTSSPNQQVKNLQNSKARNDAEARKEIQALHNQLETGADFGTLAANYSEDPNTSSSGGDMGFIPESQLKSDPAVFGAVSKLQPGQITSVLPILQTGSKQPAGYMICKLIAIEPAGQHPLSDPRVQQMIRQQLHDSRSRLLQGAYQEVLRDQARVVNYFAEDILKNAH
ncbi:MAG: SurA N-terminal domain-containing protein [Terriglobia bacterium]|nr:SurA N-terminal domain-containing protein [Terriglobia bacterium]